MSTYISIFVEKIRKLRNSRKCIFLVSRHPPPPPPRGMYEPGGISSESSRFWTLSYHHFILFALRALTTVFASPDFISGTFPVPDPTGFESYEYPMNKMNHVKNAWNTLSAMVFQRYGRIRRLQVRIWIMEDVEALQSWNSRNLCWAHGLAETQGTTTPWKAVKAVHLTAIQRLFVFEKLQGLSNTFTETRTTLH